MQVSQQCYDVIHSPRESTTQALYCRTKRAMKLHNHFLCVEMRRDKSLGGIHKQVSVMLNIKFTLSGGGGWDVTFGTWQKLPHSQSRVTAAVTDACHALCGYIKQSASCRCDNIGLVSLILLGCELRLVSLYYASWSCPPWFLCHPYIPPSRIYWSWIKLWWV